MSLAIHCIFEHDYSDNAGLTDACGIPRSDSVIVRADPDKADRFYHLAAICDGYVRDMKGSISVKITETPFPAEGHIQMTLPLFVFTSADMHILYEIAASGQNAVHIMPNQSQTGICLSIHVPLDADVSGYEWILEEIN